MNLAETLLISQNDLERLPEIVPLLLEWFRDHARDLPSRGKNPNPYHIWLTEIMAQQTRIEVVKGYFARFIDSYPTIEDLANAPEQELLKLWEGLGYYNRARNLKKAAEIVTHDYGGVFPADYDQLLALPGVGEYTAGAIASQAYQIAVPAIDGNVYRVLSRYLCSYANISGGSVKKAYIALVGGIVPPHCPGNFNQALMELGAIVCRPNGMPFCTSCPLQKGCASYEKDWVLDLPVKNPPKERKQEQRTLLFVEADTKVLLTQRPSQGLLANLWQPINLKGKWKKAEILDYISTFVGTDPILSPLKPSTHIFSHIQWDMSAWHVQSSPFPAPNGSQWITTTAEHSIPSAFSAYREMVETILKSNDK